MLLDVFVLEIRLTIKILRLDVESTLWIAALQQNKVGWHELIIFHLHYLPRLDLAPLLFDKLFLIGIIHMRLMCILFFIRHVSFVVLECILEHTDKYDEGKRNGHERSAAGSRDTLNRLHVSNKQKVHVLRLSELSVQVQRNERDDTIFGCPNRVILKTSGVLILLCSITLINHDLSGIVDLI